MLSYLQIGSEVLATKLTHVTSKPRGRIRPLLTNAATSKNFPKSPLRDRTPSAPTLTRPTDGMAKSQSLLQFVCSLLLFTTCANALKFDVEAHSQGDSKGVRCIRNFVSKDTLVVVTATVDGYKGDGMVVNMHVSRKSYAELMGAC